MTATASRSAQKRPVSAVPHSVQLLIFETAIGWFGLLGGPLGVSRLVFAHASPKAVQEALGAAADNVVIADWSVKLREKFAAYAIGKPVSFDAVEVLRSRPLTEFQQQVVKIVRAIPRGETLTYGEVAALAGSPGAARAVGTVMSTNPVPIIVPCHRVVGSAGGLGGFSAAGGVRTKRWMLDIEGQREGTQNAGASRDND